MNQRCVVNWNLSNALWSLVSIFASASLEMTVLPMLGIVIL